MDWIDDIDNHFSKTYLTKINELLNSYPTSKLIFLYLPSYASEYSNPCENDFYKNLGQVWRIPDSILNDPHNWADMDHLNNFGSEKISLWLAGKIKDVSKK